MIHYRVDPSTNMHAEIPYGVIEYKTCNYLPI